MSDTVIRVENLGKKYIIGHQQQGRSRYTALRDVLNDGAKSLGRRILNPFAQQPPAPTKEEFWALKDVSFEIKQGDRVGIIGHNGAGKSTLLKILSRITEPTKGCIYLRGRVASLLEVGTGFHPELTGRENIYLNGAILGMSKSEIKKKFDAIVDFAEVEQFLDTPVKRFSSGMYVRLAFAVAAHLEPEVLMVDEVLAVGDTQFQKKCLGKMDEVSTKEGKTVIFVSHQMASIQNLCQKAFLFEHGKLVFEGETAKTIDKYFKGLTGQKNFLVERLDRKGTGNIKFTLVRFCDEKDENVNCFYSGQSVKILIFYENKTGQNLKNLSISIGIDNQIGERIALLSSETQGQDFSDIPKEVSCFELCIEKLPLLPGRYGFTIFCTLSGVIADWVQNAGFFDVESGDYYGTGKLPSTAQGNFLIDHKFSILPTNLTE